MLVNYNGSPVQLLVIDTTISGHTGPAKTPTD